MRKPAFCICENKAADQLCGNRTADQRLCFRYKDVQSLFFLNPKFKPPTIFCGCTDRFVSDLVGDPEDRFSHNKAHIEAGGIIRILHECEVLIEKSVPRVTIWHHKAPPSDAKL